MCVIRTGKEGETGLIEIQNVSYAYEDAAAKALNNVSLTINDGELVAVVGHNGSGKSTLAKHLNALLLPTEGKVLVDGMDTADAADTSICAETTTSGPSSICAMTDISLRAAAEMEASAAAMVPMAKTVTLMCRRGRWHTMLRRANISATSRKTGRW